MRPAFRSCRVSLQLATVLMISACQPGQRSKRQLSRDSVPYGRELQFYDGGKIHDVGNAIKYLKSRVLGFFVAAPLDWGMGTEISGDLSKGGTVDVHQ
jgi:hypothetical protein